MKRKTRRGGFTLAELLIVVAIIGVLTSLAIVVYADQLEKARHTNDMSTMRAAKQALVMASMDGLIQADGKTRYYYNPSAGEVSTNIPEEGYGKSWTNSKDWWTGEGSSIGTPNVDGKHPARLSMTVSSEGKVNYYWCGAYGGLAVSSAEEFMSLSQEERLERDLLEEALRSAAGNIHQAARNAGLTYRVMQYKVKKYGIDWRSFTHPKR